VHELLEERVVLLYSPKKGQTATPVQIYFSFKAHKFFFGYYTT
jgi:hypothetical protein